MKGGHLLHIVHKVGVIVGPTVLQFCTAAAMKFSIASVFLSTPLALQLDMILPLRVPSSNHDSLLGWTTPLNRIYGTAPFVWTLWLIHEGPVYFEFWQ